MLGINGTSISQYLQSDMQDNKLINLQDCWNNSDKSDPSLVENCSAANIFRK